MSFEKMWGQPDEKVDLAQEKLKSQEKQKEAIKQEIDRLFKSLENPSVTLEDLHELVDKFAENNPRFAESLKEFQDNNSARVIEMLKANATQKEIKENEEKTDSSFEYFGVSLEDFKWIEKELWELKLNIEQILDWYKDYIQNKLNWLSPEQIKKVKDSIWKRILKINEIVLDLKENTEEWEEFKNNRWIANDKILNELWFINKELLPSLEAYLKINAWVEIPEKYAQQFEFDYWNWTWVWNNPDYIDIKHKMWEIEELLWAKVDNDWDFDEWLFSTQNILDFDNDVHADLFKDLWIKELDLSLLSENDKKIEENAILYFMAMIWVQIGVETFWWIPWNLIWWWIDLADTFSDNEQLLNIVQELWLANNEYKMDKMWLDKIMAWIWIIPWMTQIIKWSKLAKFLKKIPAERFEKAMEQIKKILWLWSEKVPKKGILKLEKITNNELINTIDKEFKDYEYFQDVLKKFILDEKHPMNIVNYLKNPETKDITIKELKEILKLWENKVSQKEMTEIINAIYEWENRLLKSNELNRTDILKKKLLDSNPELFGIWEKLSFNERKLLKAHSNRLATEILPSLKNKLNSIISDLPKQDWFPSINARAKDTEGIKNKIFRMREWNDWKKARIDYNLSDMPDAVWWRITVTDINQLEKVMWKIEETFWKDNIFEIDNFYSSAKRENPYRVITYTVLVDWVPCEIQLNTLKSSLVADLWHNTWYKQIHELPKEIIERLANLQRQTTIHEHNLLKQ